MKLHKEVIDIYKGTANEKQMKLISDEAKEYAEQHQRHFIKAMYLDMLVSYYDTLIGGDYIPYNEVEVEPVVKLIDTMDDAIGEMQKSSDPDAPKDTFIIPHRLLQLRY